MKACKIVSEEQCMKWITLPHNNLILQLYFLSPLALFLPQAEHGERLNFLKEETKSKKPVYSLKLNNGHSANSNCLHDDSLIQRCLMLDVDCDIKPLS